jgi:hypothetical protein
MSKHGEELGADLYELWVAGHRQLPQIAVQFVKAGHDLSLTEPNDDVFWRSAEMGGGSGPALAEFARFRDTMMAIFRDSQENLELAGEALTLAANEYALADHDAARRLRELQHDVAEGQF